MNRKWMVLVLLIFGANATYSASFDCSGASTKIEKMICADSDLSKLDDELGGAYSKALRSSSEPKTLKENQRNWLVERNGCLDVNCLISSYRSQIGELTGAPKKGNLLMLLSKNDKLCSEYKNYIEHEVATTRQYGHMTVPMCSRPFGEEYPEFKSVQWREVSPEDYPELAVKAYQYIHNWSWSRSEVAGPMRDAEYSKQLDSIILNHKYKWFHMWLGDADIGNSGKKETLLRVEADGRCGGTSDKPEMWVMPVMVVNLYGKDVDVEKSNLINKMAVRFPITKYHWPPKTYWAPNIRGKVPSGHHSFAVSAFDVFVFDDNTYVDQWNDDWERPNTGLRDGRYSSVGVYKGVGNEISTVCRFKFRKIDD